MLSDQHDSDDGLSSRKTEAPDAATASVEPTAQSAVAPVKPAYPPPAGSPTQAGPHGLLYDFNLGARVAVPSGNWRVQLHDLDTGNILFETNNSGVFVSSAKRYFIRFRIEAWKDGASVFHHDYNAAGREVLIQFPVGTLGDIMGWFPYAVRFQEQHGCRLTCAMSELLIPLFQDAYPHITFVTHEQVEVSRFYATYSIGLFFDDADNVWQPCDFRLVGLHRTAGYILGVDPEEMPPRVVLQDDSRPIAEPYVCIAAQSSSQAKYWNNPGGWLEIVKFLKDSGYRVICIDKQQFRTAPASCGTTSRTAPRTKPVSVRSPSARAG